MADDSSATQSSTRAQNGDGDQGGRGRGRGRGRGDRGRGGRGGRGDRGQSRGRGGGFGAKNSGGREKRPKEMGRGEYQRKDKRGEDEEDRGAKRQKMSNGEASPFTPDEIAAEARKPKRKVAVLIGYAGSGYKGMQINGKEKTIEGDIFKAFVAAGAISKANADDPKKSSLVRCARTDKGVHAAGNVISLKLIVEESDIVQKINESLPPQIRVWGYERTNGGFSCYQTCDSRWYEYLIPTYCFLPPHPKSFLGKKLVESAEKEGIFETYQSLQEDVATFWQDVDEKYAKPIINKLDPELRESVMAEIHSYEEEGRVPRKAKKEVPGEEKPTAEDALKEVGEEELKATAEEAPKDAMDVDSKDTKAEDGDNTEPQAAADLAKDSDKPAHNASETLVEEGSIGENKAIEAAEVLTPSEETKSVLTPLEAAVKEVKAAYIAAKKAYRISEFRRKRLEEALGCYVGTRNFHNYTIQKTFSDPSAKRVIRSFQVGKEPVYINDTEWLSLKVHGQSFMMHQIRKMVAMAALVVRCGTSTEIIRESYGSANISIPKAPSLGLLLERPVFETYNIRAERDYIKEKIDFDKFKAEMDEFKQREIYDRIFREEEKDHQFHAFFHHLDHIRTDFFLWVTASGIAAAAQSKAVSRTDDPESDEEADANGEEG